MNLFFQSTSHLSSRFNTLTKKSESKGHNCQSAYEENNCSLGSPSRITGYQKPKHLWMAKDQSINVLSTTSDMNDDDDSCSCSGALVNNFCLASQQISELTPLRSSYNGISPSNSSSEPGTVAMHSLTNTSSSASNHPSPLNRFNGANICGSHYGSPVAYARISGRSSNSSESKSRRKRGRPPKVKSGDVNDPFDEKCLVVEHCSTPRPSTSSAFLTGGLKMRLRRDVSVEEPICRKNVRSRKAGQKSLQVFRIVESWCDADAPGGLSAKPTAVSSISSSQTSEGFRVGDVVWAKLAGYPYWPSRISALLSRTPNHLTPISSESGNCDSLAIPTISVDPLALGFTAKVEWFAWDQCSYLSCTKLFPFVKYFTKLYNPRTRLKNYAKAVNMAKNIVKGCSAMQLTSELQSDIAKEPFTPLSLLSNIECGHSNMSCPPDLHLSFNESKHSDSLCIQDLSRAFNSSSPPFPINADLTATKSGSFSFLNLGTNSGEFCHATEKFWGPLPQLDISGLNDFNSAVPTFSEDEGDTNESLANQLKSGLDSITM